MVAFGIEFTTPLLVLLGGVGVVLVCGVLWALTHYPATKWFVMVGLLTTSTFAQPKIREQEIREMIGHPKPSAPIQAMKIHGRKIVLVPFGLLILLTLAAARKMPPRPAGHAMFAAVLGYQAVLVAKYLQLDMIQTGAGYAVVFSVNYFLFCYSVSSWVRTRGDMVWLVRVIGLSAIAFVGVSFLQIFSNYRAMFSHHMRFEGMTGNAQHAAALVGVSLPSALYLARVGEPARMARLAWWGVAAVLVLINLATGSRTGLLMLVVAVATTFRNYLPLIVLFSPLPFLLQASTAEPSENSAVRYYAERGDTRSAYWMNSLEQFRNEPLFGMVESEGPIFFVENSWLAMAVTAGVIGLGAMIYAMIVIVLTVRSAAGRAGPDKELYWMIVSTFASAFIGSLLEAFLLGAIAHPIYTIMIIMVLTNWLLTRPLPGRPVARGRAAGRPARVGFAPPVRIGRAVGEGTP